MFDNLRDQASSSPFFQDDVPPEDMAEIPAMSPTSAFEAGFTPDLEPEFNQTAASGRFLGMTPGQRFVISLLFFFAVCLIGAMFLTVTGKFFLAFG